MSDLADAMETPSETSLDDALLLHLLEHRGHQVRFEADQWTTEFGIFRAVAAVEIGRVKGALRGLEMSRSIYRRVQYVIGYSEPKLVYSLTPGGHRKALVLRRRQQGLPDIPEDDGAMLPSAADGSDLPTDPASPHPLHD